MNLWKAILMKIRLHFVLIFSKLKDLSSSHVSIKTRCIIALCTPRLNSTSFTDVHKDPDYERRVQDYTAAFQGMDNDGDGTITFEVSLQLQGDGRLHFLST